MTANGLHYHCLKKSVTKCKAKCTIVLESVVEDGVSKNKYIVEKTDELENHNHAVDEADIIAADMVNEMHKKFRESLTVKPSVIRKQIMQNIEPNIQIVLSGEMLWMYCQIRHL